MSLKVTDSFVEANNLFTEKRLVILIKYSKLALTYSSFLFISLGVYARSVHSIAEEIGIPDWLVDLRHEATHANLPSQDTLRAGVKVALSWLQKEYWEAQVSSHKDSEVKLCELLEKYRDVSSIRNTKKKNVEKQASKLQSVAEEVTSFVGSNNLW